MRWTQLLLNRLMLEGSRQLTGETGKQAAILVPFGDLIAALVQFVRFRIAFLRICGGTGLGYSHDKQIVQVCRPVESL